MTDPMRGFAPMLGSWSSRGVVVDGSDLHGSEILGTDTYEMLGSVFVVHHADVTFDRAPQRTVEIFALTDDGFRATAYTSDGTTETVTGSFDDTGVYRAADASTRTTLRTAEDTMTAHWEQLHDGSWEPWIDMTFTRLGP